MRFIGGKTLILPHILKLIEDKTRNIKTIADLFSGSGVVSKEFKTKNFNTISNDLMYFSFVLLRGTLQLNQKPKFEKLKIENPIEYLNSIKINIEKENYSNMFIYENYSPKGNRMYFTEENALRIDIIRKKIEEWRKKDLINEDEYFYLLATLLEAVPYVSNITGVYGAYLKHWDKRALKKLILEEPEIIVNKTKNIVFNEDINKVIKDIEIDLVYLDPPYNQRQYLPNYHVLETIAKYDFPNIKGVTGLRDYSKQKSDYCIKAKIFSTFDELIKNIKSKYIILSYNTEGLLTHEEIMRILFKYGKKDTFYFEYIDYLRYKNAKTNKNNNLKEVLYFIEKEVS